MWDETRSDSGAQLLQQPWFGFGDLSASFRTQELKQFFLGLIFFPPVESLSSSQHHNRVLSREAPKPNCAQGEEPKEKKTVVGGEEAMQRTGGAHGTGFVEHR